VKPNDGFAVANVEKVRSVGNTRDLRLRVLHESKKTAPAYAAIRGIPPTDNELTELLAAEAFLECVEVRSI